MSMNTTTIERVADFPAAPEPDKIYFRPGTGREEDCAINLREAAPGVYEWDDTERVRRLEQALAANRYLARTDRNIGCLAYEEQLLLSASSIAIIGLGGMGGYQAETYLRLGIGTIFIADIGTFDDSNRNRQWGAERSTINKDKALSTARKMLEIADDCNVSVCPSGLNERTGDILVSKRNVVIDMIEFWSLADRIWLHRMCQKHRVPAINCNSVIHASFGTRFDYRTPPDAAALGGYETLIERQLGMTYERARSLQTRYESGCATLAERMELMEAVFSVFMPEAVEYMRNEERSNWQAFRRRLIEEGKVPVISVNPPFAAGVCATEACFEILSEVSPFGRDITRIATFPEVTKIDLGKKSITSLRLPGRPPLNLAV